MPLSPEYHLESELRKLLADSGGSGGLFHQPPSLIKIKQLALSSAQQSSGGDIVRERRCVGALFCKNILKTHWLKVDREEGAGFPQKGLARKERNTKHMRKRRWVIQHRLVLTHKGIFTYDVHTERGKVSQNAENNIDRLRDPDSDERKGRSK